MRSIEEQLRPANFVVMAKIASLGFALSAMTGMGERHNRRSPSLRGDAQRRRGNPGCRRNPAVTRWHATEAEIASSGFALLAMTGEGILAALPICHCEAPHSGAVAIPDVAGIPR